MLNGCATTTADPDDPWEDWNRNVDSFNDSVDKAVLKPMAEGYLWSTPKPVDEGVTNFFSNIQDIGVTINGLLQFKFKQAGMDGCRFVVNTTAGIAGVIDVATKIGLPKHNEDFDQTLGVWGVPMGNYMVLPFYGSSSPRGILGIIGDLAMDPLTYTFLLSGNAIAAGTLGAGILDITDTRAGLLLLEKIVDETAIDRYEFNKSAYRQRRQYLVMDGNLPEQDDLFDLGEDFDENFDEEIDSE